MSTVRTAEAGLPLEGQVAIVTGAGQGMGLAFARRLCQAGAFVALAEITTETGDAAASELAAEGYVARSYHVDVRDAAQIQSMVDDLGARHGRIDVLGQQRVRGGRWSERERCCLLPCLAAHEVAPSSCRMRP